MVHGRDHEERQTVLRSKPNAVKDPDEHELQEGAVEAVAEAEEEEGIEAMGRIPEKLEAQRGPAGGALPAPTERAREREADRHARERDLGLVAAGTGVARQKRPSDATRGKLDRAARDADQAMSERYAASPPEGGGGEKKG